MNVLMKIALACRSILLDRALALFLKPYIAPLKQCDFVIADTKVALDHPVFLIGNDAAHLSTPFSKKALFEALEEFYACILGPKTLSEKGTEAAMLIASAKDFSLLETKIEALTEQFRQELIQTIKSHYE